MNELQKKAIEIAKAFEELTSGQSSIITYGDYVISAYHHYSDNLCDIHTYSKSQERFIDEEYDIAIPDLLEKVSDILFERKEFICFIEDADNFAHETAMMECGILLPQTVSSMKEHLERLNLAKRDILNAKSKDTSYICEQLAQVNKEIGKYESDLEINREANLSLEGYMKQRKENYQKNLAFLKEQFTDENIHDPNQQEEER